VNTRQGEQGSALLVTMVMLLALGFIGAALVLSGGASLKTAGWDREGVQAQFAAEAGVKEALHRLGMVAGTNVTANGVTFDPSISDPSNPPDPNWQAHIYMPSAVIPISEDPSIVFTPTVQSASDAIDYTRGNQLTVSHKWRDRNADGIRDPDEIVRYDAGRVPPENFDTGGPIEVIQVNGFHGAARRQLRVEATRFPFSPNVLAAIVSDNGVDVVGNVSICGHDHDAATPAGTDLQTAPACSPLYDEPTGHLPAIRTTGDPVERSGSTDLNGSPALTDTSSSNPFYSLAQSLGVTQDVIDEVLSHADHTDIDTNPLDGITYIQGDAMATNVDGSGLLYVTGDLHTSGNLNWRGLIYVEGDFMITGTPWVLGGVVVRGRSDYAFSGGSPAVLYSSEMIRLALEQAFNYVVLSWKEL